MDTTISLARVGVLMGLVAALGLSGCGGDDGTAGPAATPPPPAPTPAPTP
ncbi:MAG: MFS transporter, partial [Caulobacter sp.]|nr:MFS transporter [Vitreoscilla sp.]